MAKSGKQLRSNTCLLDLPDAMISLITTALAEADRKRFMAACRATFMLTVQTEKTTLRITENAKFAGISKVLDSFPVKLQVEIICPPDLVEDALPSNSNWPAVAVMVAPCSHPGPAPSNYCWNMVTKITIQALRGTSMRCLMPQFIAVACPQLAQLTFTQAEDDICNRTFNIFTSIEEESLPLTPCSSLGQLELCAEVSECRLPPVYHSPAEIRRSLPNITSLILKGCYNETLVEAFTTQLTQLEIWYGDDHEPQSVRQCSSLQHLHTNKLVLPDNAAALRILDLYDCSDDDISEVLQLPSLTTLRLLAVGDIKKDWSGHACLWRELHFNSFPELLPRFTTLSHLCLSNLKKLSVEDDMVIQLPDPCNPSSIAAVQRAADNLAHVGHIVLEGKDPEQDASFGRSGSVRWDIPDSDNEQAAAELIRIASQRIAPVKVCNCHNLVQRPLVLNAVLDWGRDFLESVCLGSKYELPPSAWQALRQLPKLRTVAFWPQTQHEHADDGQERDTPLSIQQVVINAAQQYVMPANRSLCIEFGISETDVKHLNQAELKILNTGWCQLMNVVVGTMMPAGSKLVSVDYSCLAEDGQFTYYGDGCSTNKFWVLVVEPSQ